MTEIEDRVAAALLRLLPVEEQARYLASAEYQTLPAEAKDRLAIADAALEERDRRKRQKARQEAAEAAYRARMGGAA